MANFGWSYPPGAATDPAAPYNMEPPYCRVCGELADESPLDDGYDLCDAHDTHENRLVIDQDHWDTAISDEIMATIESGNFVNLGAERAAIERTREGFIREHGPRPGGYN